MDSIFGIQGKDFVIIAADTGVARSIVRLTGSEDKIVTLDNDKIMALAGEAGDRNNFGEYIQKNIHLTQFRTGIKMTTKEAANYARSELAYAIRNAPYQANCLIAGYDAEGGPSLYWLDYMGTLTQLTRGAHGYGAYFLGGLLDNMYKPDITLEQGIDIVKYCINELQARFLINQVKFVVKCVTKVKELPSSTF